MPRAGGATMMFGCAIDAAGNCRRRWIGGALLVALVVSLTLLPVRGASAADPNPVVVENQQPGTSDWQMGRPGFQTEQ